MDWNKLVYIIGLVFAITIIFMSLDDFIWDMAYLLGRMSGRVKSNPIIDVHEVESTPPKLMAVIVAAYKEEDVIEDVIRNLLISTAYPHSMLHIFIGVYPNDPNTKGICERLEKEFDSVHAVTHVLEGPSSKADNINNVLDYIEAYEKQEGLSFKFFVVHDSEDVVHPLEFNMENYLLEEHYAVQIPVFPLQEKPKFGNIMKNMVTGTYADEFAENHFRTMRIRNNFKAFVPSAGTGFAIRRDVLESFDDNNIFPVGSLTEDYKLSLEFKRRGYDLYYPLESVQRINYNGEQVTEYIATRSMFPRKYAAAVRQKARWIHGITMQSFKLSDILGNKKLNFATRYSFYKDWKAKFGNLLILPSYLIFVYFLSSLFLDVPIMYPKYSTSWYLMLTLTILMLHRQVARFSAVKRIYGLRSAFVASLLPPLLPIRLVVGNVINFHATLRAWKNNLFGEKKRKQDKSTKKKTKWVKTDHEFLPEAVLARYRIQLGDILIRKQAIDPQVLKQYIDRVMLDDSLNLRTMLMDDHIIDEHVMIEAVCEVLRKQYLNRPLGNYIFDQHIDSENFSFYQSLNILPLFIYGDNIVLITTVDEDTSALLGYFPNKTCHFIVSHESAIARYFNQEARDVKVQENMAQIQSALELGILNINQAVLGIRYCDDTQNLAGYFEKVGLVKAAEFFSN